MATPKRCHGPRGKGMDLGKVRNLPYRIVRYDDGVTIHEPVEAVRYKAPMAEADPVEGEEAPEASEGDEEPEHVTLEELLGPKERDPDLDG